ncbi:retron Ec48 family effector membrane protein [Shewanella algicola]|uniref:retron Ec48 family effector membrane protein n=1 Tax=Shewanella algicola TaxID=640633 RepID=UPI0024947F50|nr:retron Ec48 family effector membrane protein [Shewanella algicola]
MKIKDFYDKNKGSSLFLIILSYCVLSVFLIVFTMLFDYLDSGVYHAKLCLNTKCVKEFFNSFSGVIPLFSFLLNTLLAIVTIFGVTAALKNYLNTTSTARLNVHLIHLNTFKDYIHLELEMEPRISKKSVDILKWYNIAFPKSRDGSLLVGDAYISLIDKIKNEIGLSNNIFSGGNVSMFKYKEHQSRIILTLSSLGIHVSRMPKKDFFEIEAEIFNLINKVNKELCLLDSIHSLPKRYYA